jgi:AraC-like DNA-binding protein
MGAREIVHRKVLRGGQRTVVARLQLGAHESVLGAAAASISVVPLAELWGDASARRLCERLVDARSLDAAAAILERGIAERAGMSTRAHFVQRAAQKLTSAAVSDVAVDLGVSERHLRRVFRDTVGVSPKTFARVARFRRALRAARQRDHASWASIAADSGYYDQAHLIREFHQIANDTPEGLLGELREAALLG